MTNGPFFNKRVLIGFAIAAVVLVIGELLAHRHGHFGAVDSWPAFYGVLGFVASAILVFAALGLGRLVARPAAEDTETSPDDLDPDLRS